MKDLTQGDIPKLLLKLSSMFMASSILGTVFSLSNFFWVGRLGAHAQAAMALAMNPIMIVLALSPIVSVGVGVLTGQAAGAKDRERASMILNEAVGATLFAATLVGGVLWSCRAGLASQLAAEPQTAALTAVYFRWLIPALVLQLPTSALAAALSGTGNVRTCMLIQTGSTALSAVAAPIFMFGWIGAPRMGLEGAGLSTFIASAACVSALLYCHMRPGAYLRLRPVSWFSRPKTLWSALRIGLPTSIENGLIGLYLMLVMLLLRPFGPHELAAFGIGQRLFQAGILPITALANAASVIAAQNFGARSNQRVRETFKATLRFGLVLSPILWLFLLGFAHPLCAAFSDDPAVVDATVHLLRIISCSLVPTSIVFAAIAVLVGLGNTRASLLTSCTHMLFVVVPACLLARMHGFAPEWLWTTVVAASLVEMAMALHFLRLEFARQLQPPASEPALQMEAAP